MTKPSRTTAARSLTIRPATGDDIDEVVDLLTDAFLISPIGDWLIPDLATRRTVYRQYFRIHVEHALSYNGFIDLADNDVAAALWFPHFRPIPEPARYEQRLAAACGEWLPRFQIIDTVFAEHHPTEPHHYLAFIGVTPLRQRYGVGGALLVHHHTNLDQRRLSAYLEATTEPARNLYLQHGYAVLDTGPFHLPEDGPPVWPMWRAPQPVAAPDTAQP